MKNISKKLVIAVCASLALLVAAMVFYPATPAYASDPYMDTNVPSDGMTNKDIELMYKHEITWLLSQNAVMRDAYQLETDFQSIVDLETKKRGADSIYPVLLSLNDFRNAVFVAQSVHDQAAKVIGAGFGFDAKGHVTNRANALKTVTDARYSLRDTHYRLVVSTHTFRRTYTDWHKQFAPR